MEAAFVVLLDPPSYNYVRNLQVKIYKLFGVKEPLKLEPHFTIKYSFKINDLTALESYFDELVKLTKGFEVTLNGIDTFDNEKNVIFIDVEENNILTQLHLKIIKDLSQKFSANVREFEGEKLHFHVTLAYKDINKETFQEIKEYLKDEHPNFKCKVKRLGLYLLPDESLNWFTYKIGNLA